MIMQKIFKTTVKQSLQTAKLWKQMKYNFAVTTKYTEEHEWIQYDDETQIAKIGVTDHAQSEIGDVVQLEFPEVGEKFTKGDILAEIESVKMTAEVFAPFDCEVLENNQQVEDDITLVNQKAEESWITTVKVLNPDILETFLSKEQYLELLSKH